jgi:hypothetical protein
MSNRATIKQHSADLVLHTDDPQQSHDVVDAASADLSIYTTLSRDIYTATHNTSLQVGFAPADLYGSPSQDVPTDCVEWSGMNWDMVNDLTSETAVARID